MLLYWIVGVIAYLLGSIPFGLILVRIFRKQDIRTQGSGNIGATNVIRSGGKGLGAVTFFLDAAKGLVRRVARVASCTAHASVAAAGAKPRCHCSALRDSRAHLHRLATIQGGKGVATGFGVFLGIAPLSALVALIAFIVVFALSRYVSLASILAAVVFPLAALLRPHEPLTPFMIAVVILLPLIVIAKHHANIRRLLTGTEYRFGKSKAAAA